MNKHSRHLDRLLEQAHPDGGWGYAPGQIAQPEPTCLVLLAATLGEKSPLLDAGRAALVRTIKPDGSYPLVKGREEVVWPTSLALYVRASLEDAAPDLVPSANFLLGIRGNIPQMPGPDETNAIDPKQDIDVQIIGWPWAEKNFSWVEPTAWACLALRHCGLADHPRVQEGIRLLIDRAFDEGGINYGNRRVLGKLLDPIPTTTALMLIALQGQSHPRIETAAKYLVSQLDTLDVEHLCWAKLALELHENVPGVSTALDTIDDRIEKAVAYRESIPWLKPSIVRQALTVLALGSPIRNVFRLPSNPKKLAVAANPGNPRTKSIGQRIGSWFRGLALKAVSNVKELPDFSSVHIAKADNYDSDLTAVLAKQFEHFRAKVTLKDKRVVLKPNLVEYHRNKVINTDPRFVSAVIELCKQEGAKEVIVAEGPGHWRNVEYLVIESGLGEVLRKHNTPFVDLNHDEPVKRPNLGQLTGLESLYLSKTIATADVVISLPKLKTHHWAGATLSLKNLFGTLPGICYGWPKNELHWRGIQNSIVDIALTRTPDLAIVDGIIGMEGDGPLNGTPKHVGAIIMGHDLVAVDATCCRLMKLDPLKIPYLVLGEMKRLGRLKEAEIPQLGETIASLATRFEQIEHFKELMVV